MRRAFQVEIAEVEAAKEAFHRRREELRAAKLAERGADAARKKQARAEGHAKRRARALMRREARIQSAAELARRNKLATREERAASVAHLAALAESWIDSEEGLRKAVASAMENPVPLEAHVR